MKYVIAPLYKRAISYFIDLLAISLLVTLCIFALNPDFTSAFTNTNFLEQDSNNVNASFYSFLIAVYIPIYIFYQTFFIYYMGATLGKFLTKTKCIALQNFQNPSLKSSFIRACLRLLSDTYFLYLGFIYAFFNPTRQTFHDKISKTVVVNDK